MIDLKIRFDRREAWVGWRRDPHRQWLTVQIVPFLGAIFNLHPEWSMCSCGHPFSDHEYANRAGKPVGKRCAVKDCKCAWRSSPESIA